jgi:hypothetical protein
MLRVPSSESVGAIQGGDRDHDADAYGNGGQINHHQIGRDDASIIE